MTWATDYDNDQAQATWFQFDKENNNHILNFAPEPALQAQWCYTAVDGVNGIAHIRSSAHAPSPSSTSTCWGLLHEGHPTLSASSDPFASSRCWESEPSMPSENDRSDEMGVEGVQSRIGMERNTETSWGERAVFVVPHQKESTQPGSVRPFFSPSVEHSMADPVVPRQK